MKRLLVIGVLLAGCSGNTGNRAVTFMATAHGVAVDGNGDYSFTSTLGYAVTVTRAKLHIGGVYLNQNVPSVAGRTGCFLDGIYTGEVLDALDVDALDPSPQPFPGRGQGTETESHTGELWLTGGAIDATDDSTIILDLAGTATLSGVSWPFAAGLTIGSNRQLPPPNAAEPGAHPLCLQRIVSPIRVDLMPTESGTLDIALDPALWLGIVDFSQLPASGVIDGVYQFANAPTNGADVALFNALISTGAYQFNWNP